MGVPGGRSMGGCCAVGGLWLTCQAWQGCQGCQCWQGGAARCDSGHHPAARLSPVRRTGHAPWVDRTPVGSDLDRTKEAWLTAASPKLNPGRHWVWARVHRDLIPGPSPPAALLASGSSSTPNASMTAAKAARAVRAASAAQEAAGLVVHPAQFWVGHKWPSFRSAPTIAECQAASRAPVQPARTHAPRASLELRWVTAALSCTSGERAWRI